MGEQRGKVKATGTKNEEKHLLALLNSIKLQSYGCVNNVAEEHNFFLCGNFPCVYILD